MLDRHMAVPEPEPALLRDDRARVVDWENPTAIPDINESLPGEGKRAECLRVAIVRDVE
jgi:hypothetical protein